MRLYPIRTKIGTIDNNTRKNLNTLIQKMESKQKTVVNPNGYSYKITYTTGAILHENGNAVYAGKACGIIPKASTIVLNNKRYIVNTTTGDVLPEKSNLKNSIIFSTKKIISRIADVITKINENFENSNVVKQYNWSLIAMTEKGVKRLKDAQKIVYKK